MEKKITSIFKGDKGIWMIFFFLCIISIVEVFSASSALTYKGGSYLWPIAKHVGLLFVGFVAMVITLNIKCRYFKMLALVFIPLSIITLLWALFAGHSTNGAQRWISIIGIQFQPSEIAKGTLVLVTAQILSAMQTESGADRRAFGYILIMCGIMVPLILLENLSTAGLILLVIYLMMIIGRVPLWQIGKLTGVVMLTVVAALSFIMIVGDADTKNIEENNLVEQTSVEKKQESTISKIFHRADTWKARILKFTDNSEKTPQDIDLDKDAQSAHAKIAIASSNVVGVGPGNSVERDFLSQAFSDFIYAIIIEEMGVEGAAIVALLYIFLFFRTGHIANKCENNFPAIFAMGLALLLVTQALFNMAVAVGLVPVTGQPLPLISKGGTSTIINCIYVGAILSVSRSAKKKNTEEKKQ